MSNSTQLTIIIEAFNRMLRKIIKRIKEWYPERTDINETFDAVLLVLKTNYKAAIDVFNNIIYDKYNKRIMAGDESFFSELNIKKVSTNLVYKFIHPLKELYLIAPQKYRKKMFSYVQKLVQFCTLYRNQLKVKIN